MFRWFIAAAAVQLGQKLAALGLTRVIQSHGWGPSWTEKFDVSIWFINSEKRDFDHMGRDQWRSCGCTNVHDTTQRCELSDIFAVKFKPAGGAALTKHEQFECDTMFKLREILHD